MMLDFLSERPTEKTTKYLLFFSFPLLIITASAVMYLLKFIVNGVEVLQVSF